MKWSVPSIRRQSAATVVGVVQFGTDLLCVGVVELVEDGECVLPRCAGGVVVAGGVVGFGEVGECVGFEVAFPGFAEQVECSSTTS